MREFHQYESTAAKKQQRPQVWKIWRKGNEVFVSHGLQGGAMQTTPGQKFGPLNVGKVNEKDPETVAQEWMDYEILQRTKKGWVEVTDGKVASATGSVDFSKLLPSNLRFWKPNHNPSKKLELLVSVGDVIWTRKRDGMQHSLVKHSDNSWMMYSSTMAPAHKDEPTIPWLTRYPQIARVLEKLDVPSGTVLSGELVQSGKFDEHGFEIDSLNYVATIVKSKLAEAMAKQEEKGFLAFCIYDLPFYGGEPYVQTKTTNQRLGGVHAIVQQTQDEYLKHVEIINGDKIILPSGVMELPPEIDPKNLKNMLDTAKDHRWEGWVLHDRNATHDDKAFSFAGKPPRPAGAAKVKPKLSADFMVMWDPDNGIGLRGKGKKSIGVGSVFAYLWDPAKNEYRYITKVGGGLTEQDVKDFADPALYPMVWEVEFASWTPEGSLQFPEFIRVRDDKKPEECLVDQMPSTPADEE